MVPCKRLLLLACAITIAAFSNSATARIRATTNHLFQQILIPTDAPTRFTIGLWAFSPATGRIRLCVIGAGGKDPVLSCSPWTGGGPSGRYRLMPMRAARRLGMPFRAGIWILNYQTGGMRACVIADQKNPVGSLKCSKAK